MNLNMKFLASMMVVLVLLVVACSPDVATPIPPTAVVTPATTPEEVPVDLSGIAPQNFRLTYTDPKTGMFKTISGSSLYSHILNLKSGFSANLSIPKPGPNDAYVVLALPEDIQAGTYHLIDYNAAFSADDTNILTPGATLAGAADYFELHEGSITLQQVNPITGAFKFSGIAELNNDTQTTTTTVVVQGAFNQLPFVETKPG